MGFPKKTDKADGTTDEKKGGTPKGAIDSKRYDAPLNNIRALKQQLDALGQGLEETAKQAASIEEERRQEGATWTFDLRMARNQQLAEFAKQDAEREAAFEAREKALTAAETDFAELLNVKTVPGDHLATGKVIRTSFEAAITHSFKEGEKAGKDAAAASYAISKRVDDATTKGEKALLEQQKQQLEARVAELTQQNKALLEGQQKTNDTVADVARKGLEAAAGMVQKGTDALNTAAGAMPIGSRRG